MSKPIKKSIILYQPKTNMQKPLTLHLECMLECVTLTLYKAHCISCLPLLRGRPFFRPDAEACQSRAFNWPMSWQWNSSKILSAFPILLFLNHRINRRITAKRDIMHSEWQEYWADWTRRDRGGNIKAFNREFIPVFAFYFQGWLISHTSD